MHIAFLQMKQQPDYGFLNFPLQSINIKKHLLFFFSAGQFSGFKALSRVLKYSPIHAKPQDLVSVVRTAQGGELEFYQYIVNSILVGPKHHYFIQQLPPIDQYYNPQPRQSHHPASYFPAQHGTNRSFHLNHISSFFYVVVVVAAAAAEYKLGVIFILGCSPKYSKATEIVR